MGWRDVEELADGGEEREGLVVWILWKEMERDLLGNRKRGLGDGKLEWVLKPESFVATRRREREEVAEDMAAAPKKKKKRWRALERKTT